jgi:hypothetical protein
VLVFDASGEPIIPMRGTIERACGCVPEYTHPVAWITELRRPLLVLSISDGGMGPFYAVFDPASREARALEPGDTFSEVQSAILGGAMWQRLR